ncbi:MAG: hypothetical protein ACO3JG_09615 [Luteolibacter sp.]
MFYLIRILGRISVIVAVLLAALVVLNRRPAAPPKVAGPVTAPAELPGEPSAAAQGEPALAVAKRFTSATSQEERLKCVRQADEVAAQMADFFNRGPGAHEKVEAVVPMGPVVVGELNYESFRVRMTDGKMRILGVVPTGDGAKVDFHAYARHGSQPWSAMVSGEAKEAAEMRVLVQLGNYYNFGFDDEQRWQNFTATSPDLEQPLQFYLERNNPAIAQLREVSPVRPTRVTLAIRPVADSHLNGQFEITRCLNLGWVLPES